MAASKGHIKSRVSDFLAAQGAGGRNEQIAGTFAIRGPSPYLRILLLLTVWAVVPAVLLQLWKFRYLVVTRDDVIVVALSKLTLAPRKIVSTTPRGQARVQDVRGDAFWTRFRFTDESGATHRYHTSRSFHRDVDGFLAHLVGRSPTGPLDRRGGSR